MPNFQEKHQFYIRLILASAMCNSQVVNATPPTHIISTGSYKVTVANTPASTHASHFLLGTHSLWWGHQNDLWIPGSSENYPTVNTFFQRTKGIIRFGGGANEISWSACTGPITKRTAVKAVDWAGPMPCLFGIPEYLSTLRKTENTNAWLIANIAGVDHQIYSEKELQATAGAAAESLKLAGPELRRYWELGNELERGRYRWSPEMIGKRANLAGQEIIRKDPSARLVVPLIEYNDPNQPSRKVFNERLLQSLTQPISDIALHLYYDGAPGGPTIPTQINTVVETAELYRRIKGQSASIWITEHGRWPEGDPGKKDWKASWYKTNDMDGVLGTADFLIALSQISDVAGAMLHGVRAGPWNVFDKTPLGPAPSGVGKLLLLLADAAPATRLTTETTSENHSRYKGGYDMRAAAFEGRDQSTIVLWAINRAAVPIEVNFDLKQKVSTPTFAAGNSLVCTVAEGRCSGEQYRVFPVNKGQVQANKDGATVSLPARSVTTLTFDIKK